ncbi:hypothetical protein glysoja_018125 [Glycine soja]|nr:hypothetical protein glysoja_018125 [Glycine soja]
MHNPESSISPSKTSLFLIPVVICTREVETRFQKYMNSSSYPDSSSSFFLISINIQCAM